MGKEARVAVAVAKASGVALIRPPPKKKKKGEKKKKKKKERKKEKRKNPCSSKGLAQRLSPSPQCLL